MIENDQLSDATIGNLSDGNSSTTLQKSRKITQYLRFTFITLPNKKDETKSTTSNETETESIYLDDFIFVNFL